MNKKILSITIILAMMFNTSSVNAKNIATINNQHFTQESSVEDLLLDDNFNKRVKEYLIKEYGENYKQIISKNKESVEKARKIESTFSKKVNGTVEYPNYVGGLYINEEDNLVIQFVEKEVSNLKSDYLNQLSVDDSINVTYVKYSYEDLKKVHDKILNYFIKENKEEYITGLYIDVIKNRVVVELKENNEEGIKKFKDLVIDSPMVIYDDERVLSDIASANPGGAFTSSSNQGCSWGYRAKTSSGETGMISAGHCFTGNGGSVSGIGTVKKWKNSGSIDAAWVQTSSGTNTLAKKPTFSNVTTLSTSVITSFYTGQKLAKLGQTTGYTTGSVTNPSYTGTFGTKFTDLVLASLPAGAGDSGAIVMEQTATFNDGFKTAGIAKAAQNNSTAMVFVKATRINSDFGLSRY